jgi:hypothetical protein
MLCQLIIEVIYSLQVLLNTLGEFANTDQSLPLIPGTLPTLMATAKSAL